jgi:hypothetical protein
MNVFEELEQQRLEVVKKRRISILILVLSLVLGFLLMMVLPFLGIPFIIAGIIIFAISESKVSSFRRKFKEIVVKKILDQELGEYTYNQYAGIPLNEIISVGIYDSPDRYDLEDYIQSSYNEVRYEMCDATFEERYYVTVDGKREVRYRMYFKGRIIKLDYKRDLNTTIKIIEGSPQGLNLRGLTKVETESIEFNKKYKTYVSNKENVFYYLTPVMIQKLMELEKLFKGTIQYSITSDAMYIFINNSGDSLEVNLNRPIDDTQLNIIKSQILLASTIINEFNLDKTKFNKEISI